MRILIIRHGETIENVHGLVQGQSPGTLSETGQAQCRALARRIAREAPVCAYSSDLKRTRDTMAEITRLAPMQVFYTASLRERAYGAFEGQLVADYLQAVRQSGESIADYRPSGGESFAELLQRSDPFLKQLRGRHKSGAVLLCTHGWIVRSLTAVLLGILPDAASNLAVAPASLWTFDLDEHGLISRHSLNETTHLAALSPPAG